MKETHTARFTHIRKMDDAVVLRPHGELMGGEETDELEKLILDLDAEGTPCLIVNLIDVGMMNSLAISRLIMGHVKFTRRKARMLLCNLDTRIQSIFVITKLALVFNVYPNEEKAIAGCSAVE